MEEALNPYQAAVCVADAELIPFFSGPIEWEGHRLVITVEHTPLSFWLVARVVLKVDDSEALQVVKWRWNKHADVTFLHSGQPCQARIQFSGGNQIRCILIVDGLTVGESLVPAKGFWIGMITVVIATAAVSWLSL